MSGGPGRLQFGDDHLGDVVAARLDLLCEGAGVILVLLAKAHGGLLLQEVELSRFAGGQEVVAGVLGVLALVGKFVVVLGRAR